MFSRATCRPILDGVSSQCLAIHGEVRTHPSLTSFGRSQTEFHSRLTRRNTFLTELVRVFATSGGPLLNPYDPYEDRLDISFHYVATTNLLSIFTPLDQDGDGIPDYLEDLNGNGVYDAASGETDWKTYNSKLGIGPGPGLITFTPLK